MAKASISISYPPLTSSKGTAFLGQNRQFQWTHTHNLIYPVIPASAATLLHSKGYKVYWDDALAENLTYYQWLNRLISRRPDYIAIETKTPVIHHHWQILKDIKKNLPSSQTILMGDHVTALPQESKNKADYILTGGDYDLSLYKLLTGQDLKLHQLPIIDRQLTKWHLYSRRNSNFKYKPGAYIMSGRDCWWGKCTFCSWASLYPHYRRFTPQHQIAEVQNLVKLGAREIFDDSGTLPVGDWLQNFCCLLIKNNLHTQATFGCNMRLNTLSLKEYQLLKKANFRLLLFGLESANQNTLNRVNKNLDISQVESSLALAKLAGLEPHLTVMIGYPWETLTDAQNTLNLAKKLFKNGLADSIQATIVVPYPGTPLFTYCQQNKLLTTQNWSKYDMSGPVIKSPIPASAQKQLVKDIYKGVLTPKFLVKKVISIRNLADFMHLANYSVKFLQKLKDF